MKGFRKQAFLLLVVFAILTLTIHFHSHARGQDQANSTCQLCHLSNISFEAASAALNTVQEIALPFHAPVDPVFTAQPLAIRLPGRAPPCA